MRAPYFKKWFATLPALNLPQRLQTLAALHSAAGLDQVIALIGQIGATRRRCPSYICERYYGHGQANGLQRYRWCELDCILVTRDRIGQTVDAVVSRGALTVAQLERHLMPRLARQVLLVSDAHAAYRSFARKHGMAHEAVNLRAGVRVRRSLAGTSHVQNVNTYRQRFRQWLSRFRGVASRYLPNYLGWRRALDGGRVTTVEQLLRIAIGVIHGQR